MVTTTKGETLRSVCNARRAAGKPILSTCFALDESIPNGLEETVQYYFLCGAKYYIPKDRPMLSGSLLAYGNVNEALLTHGREATEAVGAIPLIASIQATDPFIYSQELLDTVISMGFTGIQNMPSVGIIQGKVRQHLEQSGMGFEAEVEFISQAKVRGLFTIGYVFTEEQAALMAYAQPDLIVLHLGITASEAKKNPPARYFRDHKDHLIELTSAIQSIDSSIPILLHGGPLADVDDVVVLFRNATCLSGYTTTGEFASQKELLEKLIQIF